MKLSKKEHDEIKAYLIDYINTLWNKNKSFVEVYGKDYPKKQLESNLRQIKFNKSTLLRVGGEYDLISRNIYVYNNKYPIYNLRELKKSPIVEDLMLTLLHELLHATFSRNLDIEQDDNKLMTGLEIYDPVQGKVINSPLNEGYTEYLRNKLDKKGNVSYNQYVRIFNLLEKRMGRKAVIALGKGNVLENLAKAFNMTPDEFMEFSRNTEKKFIRERKLEILESEYEKFCEDYPEGTEDSAETKKAILKFDKSIHKGLYGNSIMEILPFDVVQNITLDDFNEFMQYKIREIRKQNRAFHEELYNYARRASAPKNESVISKLRGTVFGFIKIYNPNKKEGEIRLEYYKPLPMLPENIENTDSEDKKPEDIEKHEVFVSSIRQRAIMPETTTHVNQKSSKTPYSVKDIDIDY